MILGDPLCQRSNSAEISQESAAVALAAPLASASRSAIALANIERSIATREASFGRERLLHLIAAVPDEYFVDHVTYYREIVRTGDWPNEEIVSPLPRFIDDFERAADAYVETAFQALSYFESPSQEGLHRMAFQVTASEALRGQYGKRSPTGLDARLEQYEQDLERLIPNVPELQGALELLCTPVDPHLSAESMLLEDLAELQRVFPNPPDSRDFAREDNDRSEVAWLFLRRHARWSLAQVRNWYRELHGESLQELLRKARDERKRMVESRHQILSRLSSLIGRKAVGKVRDASTAMTLLNHLNLSLEPCFSFKGGVGLAHALIFRLAQRTSIPALHASELNQLKWRLFDDGRSSTSLGTAA